MASNGRERSYLFDADLELHDGGAITASGVGQVDGANQIIDLGASADFHGTMVVDVSALLISDNDELYEVLLEGSDSATFASGIETLARLNLGANEVITGGSDTDTNVGRYVVPFMNDANGRNYRYLRVNFVVSGTTTSITSEIYLSKHKLS